jgi:hypothetical protein
VYRILLKNKKKQMLTRAELLSAVTFNNKDEFVARGLPIMILGKFNMDNVDEAIDCAAALKVFLKNPRQKRLYKFFQVQFVLNVIHNSQLWNARHEFMGGYSTIVCTHSFVDGWPQAQVLLLIKCSENTKNIFYWIPKSIIQQIARLICVK